MNPTIRTFAGLALVATFATGCAARTAPFNEMDQAQFTVLRLQGQEPQPVPSPAPTPGTGLIPGIPPELQQMGQAALQGLQQVLPPGVIPPGLLPGQPATPVVQPPQPRFKSFVILSQRQLTSDQLDGDLKEQILDVFGSESNFSAERGNCFYPGLGISILRPNNATPVDLLVSLSCNQAQGDGFRWPYPVNGFTAETHQKLTKIYEKLWGPVPPGA